MMNSDNLTSRPTASSSPAVAWLRKSWKILLGALIGTLISNILCLPLWTDYDVMGFFRTPWNKEACMEIIYGGPLAGADAFSITSPSDPSLSTPTGYRYGRGVQFYTANLPVNGEWVSYSFTLKAHRKGMLQIMLKGPRRSNDYGEISSIFSDYRNLKIGDKEIFSDRKKVSYVKDFSHRILVNANDAIKISFDVRRHPLGADDFNLIDSENFWYIITLSILAFVIFYVLLWRVLSLCRHRTAEDAIFLFIFFLLLAIPLSGISDAQFSFPENRALAKCPKISEVLVKNANFGERHGDWFCDHLGGRAGMIKIHDFAQSKMQHIVRGRIHWQMMDNGWIFLPPFAPNMRLKRAQLRPIVTNFARLGKFCEANHIKLYVLIVPRKETIYQEYLYGYGMDEEKSAAENAWHEQIKTIVGQQHVSYIYPWKELRNASKQDYTFFKLTLHWTDWGAYIGYSVLMREIRRDFPDVPIVTLRDYKLTQSDLIRDDWYRDFYNPLFSLIKSEGDRRCHAARYNYYDIKNGDKLVWKITGAYRKEFAYRGGVYKIMHFTDSQGDNLTGFLSCTGGMMRQIRLNLNLQLRPREERYKILKYYEKEILSYKPDILILTVVESSLDYFVNPI